MSWYINGGLRIKKYCNNVKYVDYRCVLWNMTGNDAIRRLNNSKLDDKGTLWIRILVQNKTPVEIIKEGTVGGTYSEIFILVLMKNGIESHGKNLMLVLINIKFSVEHH